MSPPCDIARSTQPPFAALAAAEPAKARPWWVNFVTGASAALSGWMFVHPMDVLKVRQQLMGEGGQKSAGVSAVARQVVQAEGVAGLYAGLSAAAARQLSYGNLRLGIYSSLKDALYGTSPAPPPAWATLGLGCVAGGTAAFLSNPVEVTLADGRLPPAERRNYSNVFSGLYRIGAEDGARAYFAGAHRTTRRTLRCVVPTMVRAMVVNMLQVGGYDVAKSSYSPYVAAKTRMQNQRPLADGTVMYTSLTQTLSKIANSEGIASLWNGFGPYFGRCGGHTVFMFLFMEQYKKVADRAYPTVV
ncbi:mitochondrial carrier family [Emiliania huxleyi CCMP1516]|uniref:Mitochondrial carrier family n=2 Tax=Emiliania huxleyi TaxID=2903 RepID=A0A0D3IWZ9_EMIH1|nr:mitochondrial carrier family [Emiliania huxleyi CCMP1516]EOD15784.1 mitochondrial carrier family [Emiliania huxleyi CCMP1516]|eukprot:XP_005768213.1 mitochondrial carrier family [Emiliania huxleyi CCMP1516]